MGVLSVRNTLVPGEVASVRHRSFLLSQGNGLDSQPVVQNSDFYYHFIKLTVFRRFFMDMNCCSIMVFVAGI